jgi:hypothetical protein
MSLTDRAELSEMYKKPSKEKHNPNFHGDLPFCNRDTGHCSNTDACHECTVYISVQKVRDYVGNLKGD